MPRLCFLALTTWAVLVGAAVALRDLPASSSAYDKVRLRLTNARRKVGGGRKAGQRLFTHVWQAHESVLAHSQARRCGDARGTCPPLHTGQGGPRPAHLLRVGVVLSCAVQAAWAQLVEHVPEASDFLGLVEGEHAALVLCWGMPFCGSFLAARCAAAGLLGTPATLTGAGQHCARLPGCLAASPWLQVWTCLRAASVPRVPSFCRISEAECRAGRAAWHHRACSHVACVPASLPAYLSVCLPDLRLAISPRPGPLLVTCPLSPGDPSAQPNLTCPTPCQRPPTRPPMPRLPTPRLPAAPRCSACWKAVDSRTPTSFCS